MIIARKLCLQSRVQPRHRSLYVIRLRWLRKKDHSSFRFLLILGNRRLLSAASIGVVCGIGGIFCMFSVSFSGFFRSVSPVWKSGSIAVRGKPVPLFLYDFGIISGRSLTLLFVLLLLARLPAQNLVDVALDGLKLTDTLTLFPVVVISGVLLDGKLLNFPL